MDAQSSLKAHRYFAAEAFNQCWELMNLPSRDRLQTREMIRLAEASCWHWQCSPDRTPQNDAISYWQLSRVYALAGEASTALYYALEGVKVVRAESLEPFYVGYAWEAAARAYLLSGMDSKGKEALKRAHNAVNRVKDPASKAALELDLINLQEKQETADTVS